jgi:hypothetical protein
MKAAPLMLVALMLPAMPVCAADEFYALYAEGRYDEAMRAGEAAGSAQSLAIAARAALAQAAMRTAPCLECLERAEADARKAVAADPRLTDGHVWLAAALGLEARITGIVQAQISEAPRRARAELDAALQNDPREPYALAALGGWNIEIVHAGGSRLAKWLYGATEKEGLAFFDRAVEIAPGNVAVRYQVALSLCGYDSGRFRAIIQENLEAALHATAQTAYEKFIQARAGELLALLKKHDPSALEAKVRIFQGYP